jgi:hypothetical protein
MKVKIAAGIIEGGTTQKIERFVGSAARTKDERGDASSYQDAVMRNLKLPALIVALPRLDSLDLLLKIAFKRLILSDAKDGVLIFGKSFGDLGGNEAGIGQHVIFVELEERIQLGRPIGHSHRDLAGCLVLGFAARSLGIRGPKAQPFAQPRATPWGTG